MPDRAAGDQALPPWGGDSLSTFLSQAEQNVRISSINLAKVYALLQRVHEAFKLVEAIIEKDTGTNSNLLLTRLLVVRAHAAWLAAVRLGLSAQPIEAYPLVRSVVEGSWYALHLAKDPEPPSRAEVWLRSSEDDEAGKRCAGEFSVKNVRTTHAALDRTTAGALHILYKRTVALGGHPNERGVLLATSRAPDTDQELQFQAVILTNKPIIIAASLKMAVEAAVGAFKTFDLIFPERFKIAGVAGQVRTIVGELNTVFKAYVGAKM